MKYVINHNAMINFFTLINYFLILILGNWDIEIEVEAGQIRNEMPSDMLVKCTKPLKRAFKVHNRRGQLAI